jgi:hypothetical protein
MAKKIVPASLVRIVQPVGAKRATYYGKTESGFALTNLAGAQGLLRGAGLNGVQAKATLAELKATPFTSVKETKAGLKFVK